MVACTNFVSDTRTRSICVGEANTPRPCITDAIGASHHLTYPAAPQESTVALLFRRPLWCYRKGPSKSVPTHVAWHGQEGEAPIEGEFRTFEEAAAGDCRPDSRCSGVSSESTTVAADRITVGERWKQKQQQQQQSKDCRNCCQRSSLPT